MDIIENMLRLIRNFKVLFVFLLLFACNGQDSPRLNAHEPGTIYKLFKTENMWNFLKLNTINGFIWQVQFNVDEKKRFTSILNDTNLLKNRASIPGRFTLYPTDNIYTFILLDQLDGRTWQVQWSFQPDERLVIPIE